jgi:lipopolysaccharide biosynthesis glycosyltransferase
MDQNGKTREKSLNIGLVIESTFNEILACCVIQSAIQNNIHIKKIYVVSDSNLSFLTTLAKSNTIQIEKIKPSTWTDFSVPPMSNGTFTTYFKFDLFAHIPLNDDVMYLDTDTLIVNPIDIDFITNRITQLGERRRNILFMVPSYRPVLEKLGNLKTSNPYAYYNAGVIFFHKKEKFEVKMILEHLNKFYENSSDLMWHDQDLINSYFGDNIHPLAFKYNLSTGFLSVKASEYLSLNTNEYAKLKSPVIIHASGSILTKKWKYYPFRNNFIDIMDSLLARNIYSTKQVEEIIEMKHQISQSFLNKLFIHFKLIFFKVNECSRNFYPEYLSVKLALKNLYRW